MEDIRRRQSANGPNTGNGGIDRYGRTTPLPFRSKADATPKVRELLERLVEKKDIEEKKQHSEFEQQKKPWKWPFKWRSSMKSSAKSPDSVLMFYLNIKGELETPKIIPLYSGNMVIFRNKVYEVDPRAFWTIRLGIAKMYKVLIIKEIDRRPVSNLDWDEIRRRGDATDSDEFLIKAALRAQIRETAKAAGKWVMIIIILAVVAGLIYFFTKG